MSLCRQGPIVLKKKELYDGRMEKDKVKEGGFRVGWESSSGKEREEENIRKFLLKT